MFGHFRVSSSASARLSTLREIPKHVLRRCERGFVSETCSAGLDLAIACPRSASVAKIAWQTRGIEEGHHRSRLARRAARPRSCSQPQTHPGMGPPARLQPWALAPRQAGVMRLRDSTQEASAFTHGIRRHASRTTN
ncbi:hypothetical protein MRX96_005240 [Rhipicephalus microplus]